VGDIVIAQILQDGSTDGAVAVTGATFVENLAGTDNAWTQIVGANGDGSFPVGASGQARQFLYIGRALSTSSTPTISGTNSTSEDLYIRMYFATDVSTGTTLADVIENGTAGSTVNSAGTSATIADADVTTLGADRLALNFVAGNDDNAIDAFTGMTGGTWAEAIAEYAEASGTDGVIQLQIATIASAGTIGGGTDGWADAADSWGVVGFALKPAVAAAPVPRHGFVNYQDPGVFAKAWDRAKSGILVPRLWTPEGATI
jgi:hypothetical protein